MRLESAQYISAMPLRKIHGQELVADAGAAVIGVWPTGYTNKGRRAEAVMIRCSAAAYMSVNEANAGPSSTAAYLAADVEYVFPLHSTVNSLGLYAVGASTLIYTRWMVLR